MPIRVRLALAVAIATLVIFSVAGFLFVRSFRRGLETSLDPGLRAQATTLAHEVTTGGGSVDLRGGGSTLRTHDVVAQVLDGHRQVVSSTQEAGTRSVIAASGVGRAARGEVFTDTPIGAEGERFRVLARPVAGTTPRIVVVAVSLEPTEEAVARVRRALLVGGGLTVALAAVGAWFLAAAALRPVERMRREAADLSEHDRAGRLQVPATRDEIAALATTMNEVLARLQAALVRQRAFVADASHELRTPIAVLRTELELAGRPYSSRGELDDGIRHAADQTERLQHIADELLFLARSDDDHERARDETILLVDLLQHSAESSRMAAHARRVDLAIAGNPGVAVRGDTIMLRRAVDNLIDNAIRYAPPASTVAARVFADDGHATIEVTDEGPGFPPDFLPHAFERFRQADDARTGAERGAGLGLAIVLAVARNYGGTAEAANRPEGGAVVTVRIPQGDV